MGILTVFTLVHGLCIKNRARDPTVRTSAELIGQDTQDSRICGPDWTGTLLSVVNRPPFFRSSIEAGPRNVKVAALPSPRR
jgi:hypothetical protein